MSIKSWIILLTNSLIIVTTIILSLFFYREFQNTLDQRVLLQLTSIKRLKRVQIESYLREEWKNYKHEVKNDFVASNSDGIYIYPGSSEKSAYVDSIISLPNPEGIHDITSKSDNGKLLLLFVSKIDDSHFYI